MVSLIRNASNGVSKGILSSTFKAVSKPSCFVANLLTSTVNEVAKLKLARSFEARNLSLTNDTINFPAANRLVFVGGGINSLTGISTGASVVKYGSITRLVGADATTDGQSTHSYVHSVESIEDLNTKMSTTMSGNGSYSIFSGSASYSRSANESYHSESTFVLVSQTVVNAIEFITDGQLEDHAVQLAQNDPETFKQRFGDYYVQGLMRGGYCFGIVKILSDSRDIQTTIAGKVKASFEGIGGGSGSFYKEMEAHSRFSDISIEFIQDGGTGGAHSNLGTNFENLTKKLNDFPSIAYTNPRTFSVMTASYISLDNFPSTSAATFNTKLQRDRMVEYERQRSVFNTLRNDLQFVQTHSNLFINPPSQSKLNTWQTGITDELNSLETTAQTCQAESLKCPPFPFNLPSDLLMPERVDSLVSDDESQKLGNVWVEKESGWQGTWTRIGKSRLFEATWLSGSMQAFALLEIRIIGDVVKVLRTNSHGISNGVPDSSDGDCNYMGTLNAEGKVSGTYACPWGPAGVTLTWEAKIS